jgi:hypothetical protein
MKFNFPIELSMTWNSKVGCGSTAGLQQHGEPREEERQKQKETTCACTLFDRRTE